jgi:hypothetical protein
MSGTPKIPGPNYSLDIGGDPGKPPIESEITSTIHTPDTIKTDATIHTPDTIKTDSKSAIDLKPVAVDSCQTIKLAPLPPSHTEQPYSQHFGFTFMGVELFGFSTSGRYETFLNKPSPPRGIRHEHSGRLGRPSVIGRPHGISVRVIDSDE